MQLRHAKVLYLYLYIYMYIHICYKKTYIHISYRPEYLRTNAKGRDCVVSLLWVWGSVV